MIQTTALDLIKLALKMSGVLSIGQTPQAEDTNDMFGLLQSMLQTWNQNRWLIFHLIDVSCHALDGQISYSIGPGGDIDTVRPDRIQSAYARLLPAAGSSGPLDFSLSPISTHEEYGQIRLKHLRSFPTDFFYDASFPLGTLYVWPIPDSHFEIHVILRDTLKQFTGLTQTIQLPPEYYEALLYNLVGRASLLYQVTLSQPLVALARGALNTIRVANHRVANLSMPGGLAHRGGGWPAHGVPGVVEGTFRLDQDVLGPR